MYAAIALGGDAEFLPKKFVINCGALLRFGLLGFTVLVGVQQELYLFQPVRGLNCLTRCFSIESR